MTLDSAPVLRHGALGISSFAVSLLMVAILFVNLGFAGYATATGTATPGVNALIGIALFFCWFLALIAIGLGIAGYRDKTAKRSLSITGISISAIALVLSLGLMLLGLSQKA